MSKRVRSKVPIGDSEFFNSLIGRCAYHSVFMMKDRVLISHTYSRWEEDAGKAQLVLSSRKPNGFSQKLKVLALKWFYGGKDPSPNMYLKEAYEPAKP